jgi:dipeptidyl aminopeptidase/acylaminoacyl peptidase
LDKRPITIDDLARIRTASDPQMAPDGSRVAFVLRTMEVYGSSCILLVQL